MTHLYDLSKNSTCYSCSIDFNTYWVRLWNDGRCYQVFKLEETVPNNKHKSLEELREEIKNRFDEQFDKEWKIKKNKELIEKQTKLINSLKNRLEEEQKTLQKAINRLNDLENNRVEENDLGM